MGEKNRPFSFEGIKLGIIDGDGLKELPIVENSLLVASDEVNVREMTKVEPIDAERLTAGYYSFNLDNDSMIDELRDLLDISAQVDNEPKNISLIVEFGEYINRPKNLKYPNKKRARRIWNKWRKRYGVRPSKQVVIPRATISYDSEFKDNMFLHHVNITAENISE